LGLQSSGALDCGALDLRKTEGPKRCSSLPALAPFL
jgi:hypothetical protein